MDLLSAGTKISGHCGEVADSLRRFNCKSIDSYH